MYSGKSPKDATLNLSFFMCNSIQAPLPQRIEQGKMKSWQAGPMFLPLVGSSEPKRSLLNGPRVIFLHLIAECFNIHGVWQHKVGISLPSIYGTQHGYTQLISKNIHQRVKYIIYACRIVIVVFQLPSHVSSWPHGLQHARFLCPPLSLRVCSNSYPLSQWGYLTISSSATSFLF